MCGAPARRCSNRKPRSLSVTATPAAEPANIHFDFSMPMEKVLNEVYGPLIGRTPLRQSLETNAVDMGELLTLKNKTDLTKSEAIKALETIIGMNGITVVPVGDKFFKVVQEVTAPMAGGLAHTNGIIVGGAPAAQLTARRSLALPAE